MATTSVLPSASSGQGKFRRNALLALSLAGVGLIVGYQAQTTGPDPGASTAAVAQDQQAAATRVDTRPGALPEAAHDHRIALASVAVDEPSSGKTGTREIGPLAGAQQRGNPPLAQEKKRAAVRPSTATAYRADYRHAKELIGKLLELTPDDASSASEIPIATLTPAEAEEVNRRFEDLVSLSEAAVPAIAEFLASLDDLDFTTLSKDGYLTYRSLRMGLIDALNQIGGAEALEVARETLYSATEPAEIALLAAGLDRQAPGVYRDEILSAAQQGLVTAFDDQQPGAVRDVRPLFPLLQDYGNASVIFDLEEAYSHWRGYAAAALAALPEGAGIPSLISLARFPVVPLARKDPFVFAMLAQASRNYPEAGDALVDLAVSGEFPSSAMKNVAWYLGGKELALRLPLTNREDDLKNTASPRGSAFWEHKTKRAETWSIPEIHERLALIDQLLGTKPDPPAEQALQTARFSLSARLGSLQ